ncbi:alpha/beta hydrolase [Cupriavidus necator]|uniref:alpha/beta fold hydrolase n=1 Tax=Cupriavidus necator TaxID=106590 RepID=UPI0039C4B3F3
MQRLTIDVDGVATSYLSAGDPAHPAVLLLHGTFWSRVWQPVLDELAAAGLHCVAVDLPGLGRSGGELTVDTASVPALAAWVERFAHAVGITGPVRLAAHDIGGGIAQHLLVHGGIEVSHLALVNAVMYDSWPVPAVARFRDPAVVAATTHEEILSARRAAITRCLDRAATPELVEEYLSPWLDARVARSWMALAGAADNRHTQALVPALRASATPKLLVWGEDDPFQRIEHAERFAREMPHARLVRIPHASHFPAENDPGAVSAALRDFFLA